jgi:hypothetical protein
MKKQTWVVICRKIGAGVCGLRGHDFFYPHGSIDSWRAYTCIRCGELSRPLDSLPSAPVTDTDDNDSWRDDDDDLRLEDEHAKARRWIAWLPWPRWA